MEIKDYQYKELKTIKKEILSTCGSCEGTGYFVNFHTRKDSPCLCMKIFRYIKKLYLAGIPQDYWTLHLTEFTTVPQEYRWFIKNYIMNLNKAVNKGLGIIFFGSNGVGKTSLVSEVGKYALTQGWSVSFFTLQKYISSTYADNDMEVDTNADILIVDELDKAYVSPRSDYTPKVTEELFRNSLNAGRVVLSATNMTEEGLKSMFGPSVMSMVKRKMKFATLPGNDYSVTKQDMWTKDLLEDFNYFHPNILKMVTMKGIKESLKDDNS